MHIVDFSVFCISNAFYLVVIKGVALQEALYTKIIGCSPVLYSTNSKLAAVKCGACHDYKLNYDIRR